MQLDSGQTISNITVRKEESGDKQAIRHINEQAFETNSEANLVDVMRSNYRDQLSLVAEVDTNIVGHILFTTAFIREGIQQIKGMGLGPMAVLPDYQKQGVGSAMVRHGLEEVESIGYPFVVVLGHPSYYPRFGFEPASKYDLKCEYEDVPEEAFMIRVFEPSLIRDISGVVYYRPEFSSVI